MNEAQLPKTFTVQGRAIPTVRMTQKSKWGAREQKYLAYKEEVGWSAKRAKVKPFEGKVAITIDVYIKGGNVGDWDNYGKSICDGLSLIAYKDDRQVKDGRVRIHSVDTQQEERVDVVLEAI